MLVEHILPRARERLATVGSDAPVRDAAALMSQPHTDLVVVCGRDGAMVGVLTKTDIVGQMSRCTGGGCTAMVDTIMVRDVVTCRSQEWLNEVWSRMKERGLQRIPVVDHGGRPVGIVYARDALLSLMGEVEQEGSLLRDYVMSVGYR